MDSRRESSLSSLFQSLGQSFGALSPRREALSLLLIAAETMIVYIFAGTLLAEREPPYAPVPFLLIFTVLLISRLIPHLLETIRVWTPEYEIVMTVSIFLTMLAVIKIGAFPDAPLISAAWLQGTVDALILQENASERPIWMLVAFTGYAWWRGRTRAEASLETCYSMLRFGLIWIAAGLFFTIIVAPQDSAIFPVINTTVVGFLVFTLLAIAIARQPEAAEPAAWSTHWIWLLIFAVPILAIAATTISTVGVLTRDTLDLMLAILYPAFWLLRVMLQSMVLAIAVIAFILISPIIWFLERQGFRPLSNLPNINLSPGSQVDADSFASTTLQIENPIRYLIAGLVLLALFWFLARFAFRRRRRWREVSGPQRDSLIDWDETPASLVHRFRAWVTGRFRRPNAYPLPDSPEWAATRRIRQLYQRFLRVNKARNLPREPGETPAGFAVRLTRRDQELGVEIDQITRQYNQARYSGRPADALDADQVERSYAAFVERVRNDSN